MLSSAFAAAASLRSTYGKYVPHQRFNVDQVPLPFINGMDDTSLYSGSFRKSSCAQGEGGSIS